MNPHNFDFNHGSGRSVDDPRSPDISDRVNAHIDAAFFAKRANEVRREYVGASAIGDECLRKIQFGYLNVPPDEGRMNGKTLRIFNIGHRFEDILAEWLRDAGFILETVDPSTGKQFGFSVMGGKGKGHLDGILRGGPVPLAYPALWECKALNEKGWQDVKKRGLAIAKPMYAAQVAIDQAYLDLTSPALFTALNKNTEELHHELIPFDKALAQAMSDKMALIVQATKAEQLLPRAYSAPDHFMCRFCDYAEKCWALKR